MRLLLLGRVLGGISTSLLFSAFESWLVSEHRRRNFPEQWLERTFSFNGALNGVTAIAAGLFAQLLTVNFGMGNIGPFRGAIALTTLALVQILPWEENHGDRQAEVGASLWLALGTMRAQPSLWLLGVVQSLFEGAMYTFVFNWVRAAPAAVCAAAAPAVVPAWLRAAPAPAPQYAAASAATPHALRHLPSAPSARAAPPRLPRPPPAGSGARASRADVEQGGAAVPSRPGLCVLHALHRLWLRALRAGGAQARRAPDRRAHARYRHGRARHAGRRRVVWRGAGLLLRV